MTGKNEIYVLETFRERDTDFGPTNIVGFIKNEMYFEMSKWKRKNPKWKFRLATYIRKE